LKKSENYKKKKTVEEVGFLQAECSERSDWAGIVPRAVNHLNSQPMKRTNAVTVFCANIFLSLAGRLSLFQSPLNRNPVNAKRILGGDPRKTLRSFKAITQDDLSKKYDPFRHYKTIPLQSK
jgi:hypothetical protein